ncbi:MAG: hypothetical protein U0414_37160 [Polyangiaceae bacterium]
MELGEVRVHRERERRRAERSRDELAALVRREGERQIAELMARDPEVQRGVRDQVERVERLRERERGLERARRRERLAGPVMDDAELDPRARLVEAEASVRCDGGGLGEDRARLRVARRVGQGDAERTEELRARHRIGRVRQPRARELRRALERRCLEEGARRDVVCARVGAEVGQRWRDRAERDLARARAEERVRELDARREDARRVTTGPPEREQRDAHGARLRARSGRARGLPRGSDEIDLVHRVFVEPARERGDARRDGVRERLDLGRGYDCGAPLAERRDVLEIERAEAEVEQHPGRASGRLLRRRRDHGRAGRCGEHAREGLHPRPVGGGAVEVVEDHRARGSRVDRRERLEQRGAERPRALEGPRAGFANDRVARGAPLRLREETTLSKALLSLDPKDARSGRVERGARGVQGAELGGAADEHVGERGGSVRARWCVRREGLEDLLHRRGSGGAIRRSRAITDGDDVGGEGPRLTERLHRSPEREDVRADVGRAPREQLGRHERGGAARPGRRERGPQGFTRAEVDELGPPGGRDHRVRGLHVPMHEAEAVRRAEASRDVHERGDDAVRIHGLGKRPKIRAVDALHREKRDATLAERGDAKVEDSDEVRVLDASESRELAEERLGGVRVGLLDDLERDLRVRVSIRRSVGGAAPTLPEDAVQLVSVGQCQNQVIQNDTTRFSMRLGRSSPVLLR